LLAAEVEAGLAGVTVAELRRRDALLAALAGAEVALI
jgi:hypothetical protein